MGTVGPLLRGWRQRRRMTQQDLAGEAEVSTRHLSCLETGKAQPSREMVLVLASAMEVPLRERNTLLRAAGFAPAYRQTDLGSPQMAQVRAALEFLLGQQEPYGAVVVDRTWDVLMMNGPMRLLAQWLLGEAPTELPNLLELTFSEAGLKPYLVNWDEVARSTLDRLHREALAEGDDELHALRERLCAMPGVPEDWRRPDLSRTPPILIPITLRKDGMQLSMFTTVTTLGTPLDITLSELRIESYFPADASTEAALRALAAG